MILENATVLHNLKNSNETDSQILRLQETLLPMLQQAADLARKAAAKLETSAQSKSSFEQIQG
jgi:hypothetical protein